jgi:SAM-dependent methyltransferase/uncharacterized protein YbaR (Trm112 family)
MSSGRSLSPWLQESLRCPICRGSLRQGGDLLHCSNAACGTAFPVVRGVPVLLNEAQSLFRIEEVSRALAGASPSPGATGTLRRLVPTLSANFPARDNFRRFATLLEQQSVRPRLLVIGAGALGEGYDHLLRTPSIDIIETDVAVGPRVGIICDAHDLPFDDARFDGVVAQAVLEHVTDPYHCVDEIHRVLKPRGLVYAETPFIQQVHLGRFDFSRFTHLGHRRLFRAFEEIESGVSGGPGMALAWSYTYFLQSFFRSRLGRRLARAVGSFTSFYLKYFDRLLASMPGSYDAASGYFLLARRSEETLSDRDLIAHYRGAL